MNRNIVKEYDEGKRDFVGANLYGANLYGANLYGANLYGANLRGADLRDADFVGANLRDANLRDANLGGANLGGANLRGADLGAQWIIQGPCRSDGYWFHFQKLTNDTEPMIRAGCRCFTLSGAHEHWQRTRAGTQLGNETFAILDCLEALAKARGIHTGGINGSI